MPGPDEQFTLPAVHALHLADVVKSLGPEQDELFLPLGLDAAALGVPGAQLLVGVFAELVARARSLTGNQALGILLGLRMRASAHGFLGFAAMTASNLREALETTTRFFPTRTNALGLQLHVSERTATLVIEELTDFGQARDVILLALTLGIWQMGEALTGRRIEGSADFAFPPPSYIDKFGNIGLAARFGQPVTQLVFAASALDLPLMMADRVSQQLAYSQLEQSLAQLGGEREILARVRKLCSRPSGGFHSLEEVATELRLSPRTLKRRLATQGATYSDVLEEQRRELAMMLLRSPGLSVDEVATRLGYSDTSNFRRAFRRWTDLSPAAYRRGGDAARGANPEKGARTGKDVK